ncbi:MAG: dihydrodipicolinate synthase family protein [Candidatus Binatia bacterium]
MQPRFRGIFIPLITPFHDDGEVDFDALSEVTEFMIERKVHGLFVIGSTGMGPVMTTEQRIKTAEFAVKQVRRRVPVIMHVGTADVQTTIALAKHADGLGVDAVAAVPPFYYTDHTPWEVTAHFKAIAAEIKSPLFLYDNEKYTGFRFTPPAVKKLKEEVPSLCGMKASYNPLAQILGYIATMPQDFTIMSGNSLELFPAVPHGLSGSIPPQTQPIAELLVALWNALEAKQFDQAAALQKKADDFGRVMVSLGGRFGRSALREALRQRGLKITRYPRWPSENLSEEAMKTLSDALKRTGV